MPSCSFGRWVAHGTASSTWLRYLVAAGPACKSLLPIAEWEPEMSIVFLCNCLIFGAIAWLHAAKLSGFF